ncbi:MAG: choice-of-anchor O protein [Thiomicrorhabdus chilensis]|uniref:choice-of-anchor O protein n=1 Tax=Thiomicrorhabdus chilensis TaxID=63656 RepID=UPI00299CE5F8|nr:choice-of-anchor O protein [Thiomicrorhabdus chilensis]MDX1348398.1 choice-of-anchor O protein [Thiomicrorhabdus chilensis]
MIKFQPQPLAAAMAVIMGVTLYGCNGGSSSSTSMDPTIKTGTFVDSPVNGLTYAGDVSGTTADGGKYRFKENGMVKFSVGNKVILGTLKGSTFNVTPLDFFEGADVNDPRVVAILILLQSLDEDNDAGNGINISNRAITELERALEDRGLLDGIDFSAMTVEEARAFIDTTLIPALTDVVASTPPTEEGDEDGVVTEEEAVEHFTFTTIGGDITLHKNISRTPGAGSGGHSITSMMLHTSQYHASGEASEETAAVRPLLVSYTDIVTGDFQMGTGSSEIPDIDHVADTFVALSLDKGVSWKPINISNTADKSSIQVDFWGDGVKHDYYGHSFKPAIKTEGNKVLVAWNDKYCPTGNPSELADPDTEDLYLVNGPQGTINYEGIETYGEDVVPAHEVPFSCVWTARGVFNEETHEIDWHAPMQLTSGRRDSNKITISSSEEGFVMAWQEDTEGLRPGGGAGPGEGWSGASTNHRTDIWYSYIPLEDGAGNDYFAATEEVTDDSVKPKSLYNLSYPVPISDNAVCKQENVDSGTSALYCAAICNDNGYLVDATSNDDGKCYTSELDPIRAIYDPSSTEKQLLNGDTGASRPILGIFGDNVILGYEETKGEAESLPGIPNTETLDSIPLEAQGKIAYVHSFKMADPTPISAGTIVNELRPNEEDGTPVLENVRRLTMVSQVDSSEATADNHLWGILYKSGIETQGASSDMYLRLAKGGYSVEDLNTVADMQTIMGDENWSSHSWNLSSRTADAEETVIGTWDATNLNDATWENNWENTFSPRGFLRGDTIFIGYEYTQSWRVASVGHLSNNFNVIRSFDNGSTWQEPKNISNISNNIITTLDPRLIPTSEPIPGLETAAPNTVFVTYGTAEMASGLELDLFVTRTTDNGENWDTVPATVDGSPTNEAIVKSEAEEKEVQNIASPDGSTLYTVWLQELDPEEASESAADYLLGSDIWGQRKDYTE